MVSLSSTSLTKTEADPQEISTIFSLDERESLSQEMAMSSGVLPNFVDIPQVDTSSIPISPDQLTSVVEPIAIGETIAIVPVFVQRPTITPLFYSYFSAFSDFNRMIGRTKYDDALFLFVDCFESHNSADCGSGSASIRPYNSRGLFSTRPRSAGITMRSKAFGGFPSMESPGVRKAVEDSLEEIRELNSIHNYNRIIFSAKRSEDPLHPEPTIASNDSTIGPDVIRHVTNTIYSMGYYSYPTSDFHPTLRY